MTRSTRKKRNSCTSSRRMTNADVPILKDIRETLENQQTSSVPTTRDAMIPRIARNKIYTFEQTVNTSIVTSTMVESDTSLAFSLSQLTNNTSFTSIFDTYRIIGIVVKFFPAGGTVGPPVYTAIDYDDANNITISTMQTYDTLKIAPAGAFFERSLIPRSALAAYSGAFTSYAQVKGQWLDCASPTVQHYGLKINVPAYAGSYTWNLNTVYFIQFKNTR